MSYRDANLTCLDCSRPFTFSAEDQGLSGELGYDPPVRCLVCRVSRESARRRADGFQRSARRMHGTSTVAARAAQFASGAVF